MIEETENQEQSLEDLIERVEQDDLPTNVFTTEDTDPMVLLGKINEVIGYLRTLQGTIESSDTKATQALASAIQALETANTALSSSTTALTNANQALSTANTAISSANTAVETANTASTTATEAKQTAEGIAGTANQALSTAQSANTTANSASATANSASATATEAKQTAEGIAGTANQALSTAQSANTTANTANTTANTANTTANSANTTATEARQTANSASTTATNANITANNANSTAQQALTTAQGKQDPLTETQLNNIDAVTLLNQQVQTQESSISDLSNNKVTKTDSINKIYGTDSNGDQITLDYSQNSLPNKIVQRDSNGDVIVHTTPTSNNGATPKSYVDALLAGKINKATLLWANPNIGYGFHEQTITITNAGGYDYLLIEFRQIYNNEARNVQLFRNYNNVTNVISYNEVDNSNNRFVTRSRTFTKNSNTSITWGQGRTWYSNSGIDNDYRYMEPSAIYGITL